MKRELKEYLIIFELECKAFSFCKINIFNQNIEKSIGLTTVNFIMLC